MTRAAPSQRTVQRLIKDSLRLPGKVYGVLRLLTPVRGHYTLGGVPVLERRLLDERMPYVGTTDALRAYARLLEWCNVDEWESALIEGVQTNVRSGDRVVIVGGGWGVTTVFHARMVGEDGSVTVLEGSLPFVRQVRETCRLNGTTNVRVVHAVVGAAIDVWDEDPLPEPIHDVPECDVLELDCEGAERDILSTLVHRPRVLLVETHGVYGAPTTEIESLLLDLGYAVTSCKPSMEPNEAAIATDVMVLQAIRKEAL